jgi:hypothetical protein
VIARPRLIVFGAACICAGIVAVSRVVGAVGAIVD